MKDSWICRDYQDGDEHQILALYKEVNKREMSLAHWTWKFTKNPCGQAVIKEMFDGNKLIGHYSIIPMNVQVHKTIVKAALSVNTMTHPDYERQGIFSYLAEDTYKKCQRDGFGFVYGFPNDAIYQPRIRRLNWKGLGKMSVLQKNLESSVESASRPRNIYKVDMFDTRVNSLWNKVKDNYNVIVPRTEDFLNWRFTEHPAVKYSKYIYQDGSNKILGYMVLKTYPDNGETKGHIVDLLCIEEKDIVKDFLSCSYNYFFERGINNLSCWAPEGSFYSQVFEGERFGREEFGVYFGVRTFGGEKDRLLTDIEQMDNWHLTMCDLDVF